MPYGDCAKVSVLPYDSGYTDFGAAKNKDGSRNKRAKSRPHCIGCGPFAGRYMRRNGTDEVGVIWICKGCDNE